MEIIVDILLMLNCYCEIQPIWRREVVKAATYDSLQLSK